MNQGRSKGDSSAEHIRIQAYLKNREKELEKLKSDAVQWLNHLRSKMSAAETKNCHRFLIRSGRCVYFLVSGADSRNVHPRVLLSAEQ